MKCLPVIVSLVAFAIPAAAQQKEAAVFAEKKGAWVTIYINDFKGMNFVGVSKHQACVSAAMDKADEFRSKGHNVSSRLVMSEMVAFEISGHDDFVVFCNANGTLVVEMLVKGDAAEAMAKRENSGSVARTGSPEPSVTRTEFDLNTGKASSTTITPNE